MSDTQEILADTNWIPHRLDRVNDRVQFVHFDHDARKELTFLANKDVTAADKAVWIAGDEIRSISMQTGAIHFIFHTAFCRSTLLVKALDLPEVGTGLSEPRILNDLAAGVDQPYVQQMIAPILNVFARPLPDGKAVVIKPSNHANQIIPVLMQSQSEAKAILLTSSVSAFLKSVAKKGMEGRVWVRRLFREISAYAPLDLGLDENGQFDLTDLQVTGLTWLLHQRHFALLLKSPFGSRMNTLDSDRFNDNRTEAFRALADHFALPLDQGQAREIATGVHFAKHVKYGGDYKDVIAEESAATRSSVIESEIEYVEHWLGQIIPQLDLTVPIDQSLF